MWNIRQNYTGHLVYVPDEGIAKEIVVNIDVNYLLHYSYLLIPKPFGEYIYRDLRFIASAFGAGNMGQIFHTQFTAVIGNSLLLKFVIESVSYHEMLQDNGIESYKKNVSSIYDNTIVMESF